MRSQEQAPDRQARTRGRRAGQFLLGLVTLVYLYVNAAVAVGSRFGRAAPMPDGARSLFTLHGVFSTFATNNSELSLWGLVPGGGGTGAYWRELPADEYVPYKRGHQRKLLWAHRQRRELGVPGHQEAWSGMGRRLMARYNREHPGQPITAIALQSVSWPSSPEGFYARQGEAAGRRQFWIIADASE
jgi:hypothetical protein